MSREALIGMTLMLTLAVLGAGQEAPDAAAALADDATIPEPVVAAPALAADEAHRVTLHSPVGTVHLIGATAENELSVTVRFDDSI